MSAAGSAGIGALPSITTAAVEPESVRKGTPAVKHAYEQDVAFENLLLEQLSQAMSQSAGLTGEGSEGSEESAGSEGNEGGQSAGSAGLLSSMIPQTLAHSLSAGGGVGLAAQLVGELQSATPPAAGATAAGGATADGTTEAAAR
jgi:Rod binding domain-containing protein